MVLDPGLASETRLGHVVHVPQTLYDSWRADGWHIAQLELLMVLAALSVYPEHFRGRTGLWFLDNVAALMAVVRGRSDTPDLDQLAMLTHAAMFGLETSLF